MNTNEYQKGKSRSRHHFTAPEKTAPRCWGNACTLGQSAVERTAPVRDSPWWEGEIHDFHGVFQPYILAMLKHDIHEKNTFNMAEKPHAS